MRNVTPPLEECEGRSLSLSLHRHAIESILIFSDLRGLAVASSICKDWNAAIKTMAPINGACEETVACPRGAMTRHVQTIHMLSPRETGISALQLRMMCGTFTRLREVNVNLSGTSKESQSALDCVAKTITNLTHLAINFQTFDTYSLSALVVRAPNLRHLRLNGVTGETQMILDLRALPALHTCSVLPCMNFSAFMNEVLRTPHTLGWKSIGHIDQYAIPAILSSLPTLTYIEIDPSFLRTVPFSALPRLCRVDVCYLYSSIDSFSLEPLRACRSLETLSISLLSGSPHIDATVLRDLPLLRILHLTTHESLAWLRDVASCAMLEYVTILWSDEATVADLLPLAVCPRLREIEIMCIEMTPNQKAVLETAFHVRFVDEDIVICEKMLVRD